MSGQRCNIMIANILFLQSQANRQYISSTTRYREIKTKKSGVVHYDPIL